MDESLLNKLQALKSKIDNDNRVILLNKLDKELSNNEEVMKLSYQKDMMCLEFEDALKHFGESSNEVKIAQKKLYEAKLALDSYPLVKQYNEAYKNVRELYEYINKALFADFKSNHKCGDFND